MSATDVYQVRYGSVYEKLTALRDGMDKHAQKQIDDPYKWGYAGDLAEVESKLDDILAFLGVK